MARPLLDICSLISGERRVCCQRESLRICGGFEESREQGGSGHQATQVPQLPGDDPHGGADRGRAVQGLQGPGVHHRRRHRQPTHPGRQRHLCHKGDRKYKI